LLGVAAFVAAALVSSRADAQAASPSLSQPVRPVQGLDLGDPRALVWNDRWSKFSTFDYAATAVIGGAAAALYAGGEPAREANWDGPILFDKPIRDALRVRSAGALRDVRMVGDVFTITPVAFVFADSLFTPIVRGRPDIAWQLSMMNLQAHAVTGLFLYTMFETVGRARPSYRECEAGTSQDPLCKAGTFASFPSGHTGGAMTAAGLTCAHHLHLALYGGGAPDTIACISAITLASGSGLFRLIGDRHYATDVLVGGTVGFLVGYGIPTLFHYRERPLGEIVRTAHVRAVVTIGAESTPAGASVLGTF